MTKFLRNGIFLIAGVLLFSAAFTTAPCAGELILPDDVFFYRPVASVFDQSAAWNNPAALGNRQIGSVFMFTQRDNRAFRDYGGAASMRMLSMAYRHIENDDKADLDEYVFAIGGGKRLQFGFSYRYFKNAPGHLNHRHLWNGALLLQHSPNFSVGARVENLNRGVIDGEKSDIRFVYGGAMRFYKDLVTVSFDVDMTQKENIHQADFRTGIEVRPEPGLYLFADFDNHSRFNLGFRINIEKTYGGHYHNFDRHGKSFRGTTYVGSVKGNQPSLIKTGHKALVARLDGEIPENPMLPIWGNKPLKYYDYVSAIYRAADDDEIERLFLNIGSLECGLAKTEELSRAVKHFRSRGKKVYAYIAEPNNLGYLLASVADTVIIPPVSQLNLIGLRAQLMTVKGLMDKVGIEAEIERVEKYKSAPEMFIHDRPSEPYREQTNRLLDNMYADMISTLAENRGLSEDSVKKLIDMAPMASEDAASWGLVDSLAYRDDALKAYAGSKAEGISGRVSLDDYVRREYYCDRWGEKPRLALLFAEGEITAGESGGRIGEYEMLETIKKVRGDSGIKGIVLRINSPGGSALASDLIWHELQKTVEKKPVIISMSNVAASGGYYISCLDSDIFVDRNTITGSIGVYGGKINLSEMFDKIGIYTESYTRGRNANMYSLYEPFTPEQREHLRRHMWRFYEHFTQLVGEKRNLESDSVDALGRGRVWVGTEAVANGLADDLGGIQQALEALLEKTDLERDEVEIVTYPEKRYLFRNPFDFPLVYKKMARWLLGDDKAVADIATEKPGRIYFRLPYRLEIE